MRGTSDPTDHIAMSMPENSNPIQQFCRQQAIGDACPIDCTMAGRARYCAVGNRQYSFRPAHHRIARSQPNLARPNWTVVSVSSTLGSDNPATTLLLVATRKTQPFAFPRPTDCNSLPFSKRDLQREIWNVRRRAIGAKPTQGSQRR